MQSIGQRAWPTRRTCRGHHNGPCTAAAEDDTHAHHASSRSADETRLVAVILKLLVVIAALLHPRCGYPSFVLPQAAIHHEVTRGRLHFPWRALTQHRHFRLKPRRRCRKHAVVNK
ncbi:hypothetical protein MRB53_038087 [Persea americana]|nr:hypothetical protein MRB53_038087 [Persea americana]